MGCRAVGAPAPPGLRPRPRARPPALAGPHRCTHPAPPAALPQGRAARERGRPTPMTGPVAEARIVLDRVSKRYEPGRQETVLAALRRPAPRHEHWALRDVDLSVQPGEAVAVLGDRKSTRLNSGP